MRRLTPAAILFALAVAWLVTPFSPAVRGAFGQNSGGVIYPTAPAIKSLFSIFRTEPKRLRRLFSGEPNSETKPRTTPGRDGAAGGGGPNLRKDKDAKTVVVFGDFLADMLARGLEDAFADTPAIRVVSRASETASLATGDITAFAKSISEAVEKDNMAFAVLMIGANDQHRIKAADVTFEYRGEGWEDAYKTRLTAIMSALRATGKPVYFLGLPPVADPEMNAGNSYLNEIYRSATLAIGGRFIDIWTVFLDADGQFTRDGPDIEGNEKQLRWRDGIRFTGVGRRKLAHYVEREIRRDAGLVRGAVARLNEGTVTGPSLYTGPWADRPKIGPVVSLTSPQITLGAPLLGDDKAEQSPRDDTPQYHFVTRGEPLAPPQGRVDDFSWPPLATPTAAATPPPGAEGTPTAAADAPGGAEPADDTGPTADSAPKPTPGPRLPADVPIIIDPIPAR